MRMITRSARVVSLVAVAMLAACGSDGSTGPTATVSPTDNPCAAFAATPAVVLTQGVLAAGTVFRTEARWCESSAPVLQTLEFNPAAFAGGVNAGIAFTQAYAGARGTLALPAGVTTLGGPRGL